MTWCIILLEVAIRKYCSYKRMDMISKNTQVGCGILRCTIGTKCAKKISPTPLHHHQPEPLRQGMMDPCFHVLYAKFWPTIWMSLQKSRLIRPSNVFTIFYCPIFVSLCELLPPFPVLSWQEQHRCGLVFCCCSPSASGFDVLCIQRWYSAYLGCNKWLFELLLPFYHL